MRVKVPRDPRDIIVLALKNVGFSVSLFIPSLGVQGCVTSLAQIPPLSLRHKLNAIKKKKIPADAIKARLSAYQLG